MKHIKLALLVTLALILAGCNDDGGGNGGKSGGGDYSAYWNTIETIAVDGYTEMTQKPEEPAPPGDQEDCPMVMLLLIFSWEAYIIGVRISRQRIVKEALFG